MNIKPWRERGEWTTPFPLNPVETAMQAEIDEMRAALKAQPVQPARPCKVGGDCVSGKNSACACSELSAPNPPVMQRVQTAPLTDEQIDTAIDKWFSEELEYKGMEIRMRAAIEAAVRTGGAG